MLGSLLSLLQEGKVVQPEADGSHGPFWPDWHPDCLQIQNLENFTLYLLRESRESKSTLPPPPHTPTGYFPSNETLQNSSTKKGDWRAEGPGEGEDAGDREESLTTPAGPTTLSGPHSLSLPPGVGTMPSPLGQVPGLPTPFLKNPRHKRSERGGLQERILIRCQLRAE